MALRLALAYPDVFKGAILNAGSDPIGQPEIPLPPAELFRQFQAESRLYYLTGEKDAFHLSDDGISQRSMRRWCVFGLGDQTMPFVDHIHASAGALALALSAFATPRAIDPAKPGSCRKGVEQELTSRLQEVRRLADQGLVSRARARLAAVDTEFGGLAAPESLALAQALGEPAS